MKPHRSQNPFPGGANVCVPSGTSFPGALYVTSGVRNDQSCQQLLTLKHRSPGVTRRKVTGASSEPREILGNR